MPQNRRLRPGIAACTLPIGLSSSAVRPKCVAQTVGLEGKDQEARLASCSTRLDGIITTAMSRHSDGRALVGVLGEDEAEVVAGTEVAIAQCGGVHVVVDPLTRAHLA